MKKAQGLSLNVIIIAALSIVVLVVLVAILTGRISLFSQGIADSDTTSKQAICMSQSTNRCSATSPVNGDVQYKERSLAGIKKWIDCPSKCWEVVVPQ